ncbi:MAG: ABC transporter permease subunit [Planctomycetes bacterium]|nr:ABC transporter permease subunit [Planctomycetota bacterium]
MKSCLCLSVSLIPFLAVDAYAANQKLSRDELPKVTVASKSFTESVLLGEIVKHLAESTGTKTLHRKQLGGTPVVWNALLSGDVDVYVDYTGTLIEELLSDQTIRGENHLRDVLAEKGIRMSRSLGFNNRYELGMKESIAAKRNIRNISDLKNHPDLKFGFSNEFMDRKDGWPKLQSVYRLPQQDVTGLNHDLAYRGLDSEDIHVIDTYSTDAKIKLYHLRILDDDLNMFPQYNAVLLYRKDLETRLPQVVKAFLRLEGVLSEEEMTAWNARVELDRISESVVAAEFLHESFGIEIFVESESRAERIWRNTKKHLFLVAVSMTAAIVLAIPLGITAARRPLVGQIVLGIVGLFQTVPSLVMFVVLIPYLGLGAKSAIFALFLYSLLPIVRNTYAGLHDIPRHMHESAEALGLPPMARLRFIELPMAARSILAGIKTAVVINVGTATLGGFIGAGGYGDPILTGIRLSRTSLVLEGAIPAAIMALLAQGIFELAERRLVPKGLRLKTEQ